jgi:spore maturation protein SpmB
MNKSHDPSLPNHAADKVSRALHDVLSLTDESGEKLRIALMAATVPLGAAGGVLAAMMKAEGKECTQAQAVSYVVKLVEKISIEGPDAAWDSLQDRAH